MKDERYKKTINNIIAADDLHWNDDEQKYVALSNDEIDNIILNCVNQEILEENDLMHVMKWATHVKVGHMLFNNFLKNQIKIIAFDETGEPIFDTI
jgi:hypothetical protein